MTNEKNVKTIETLYAAFAVGDMPKVLAGLDEKVIWNERKEISMLMEIRISDRKQS